MKTGASDILLAAEGLARTYTLGRARIPVLAGASLTVRSGETVAITGRSGSGKSTLLHVLGGLDAPDAGRVAMLGCDLYGLSAGRRTTWRRRCVGFVFQSYHLLPELTVLENVLLPAMAGSGFGGGAAARRRAGELLDAVGLSDRVRHLPMELSGGEQQRAALARALMNQPPLLLADEPTGNLDDQTGAQVLASLFELVGRAGHALVIVTHSAAVADRCHRVLRLHDGRLQDGRLQDGPPIAPP